MYAKLVLLLTVATCVPLTPGTEERLNGSVNCQHSKAELLFVFVTSAVAVKYVIFGFDWAVTKTANNKDKIIEECILNAAERGDNMKSSKMIQCSSFIAVHGYYL